MTFGALSWRVSLSPGFFAARLLVAMLVTALPIFGKAVLFMPLFNKVGPLWPYSGYVCNFLLQFGLGELYFFLVSLRFPFPGTGYLVFYQGIWCFSILFCQYSYRVILWCSSKCLENTYMPSYCAFSKFTFESIHSLHQKCFFNANTVGGGTISRAYFV